MVLWRISRHRDLSGAGGLAGAGRWHHAGQPVVYLAETPAAALLEVCVHTVASAVMPTFTLLKIVGPEVTAAEIQRSQLPSDWPEQDEVTRNLGTQWLRGNSSLLLRVPSVILPETNNYLFNPLHRDAKKFAVVETIEHPFDLRLKQ
jgi:RES domain-containing protein